MKTRKKKARDRRRLKHIREDLKTIPTFPDRSSYFYDYDKDHREGMQAFEWASK